MRYQIKQNNILLFGIKLFAELTESFMTDAPFDAEIVVVFSPVRCSQLN